jgi:FKBP-type peptidyl-prolyl cis-trans isomerase|tara:strand:- start:318 stop:437 length:120 start_codon:yes stop_codon:yes gene_type:complete
MPVGKKVIVKIPPEYAYGAKGTPGGPIPPDAPLLSMAKS